MASLREELLEIKEDLEGELETYRDFKREAVKDQMDFAVRKGKSMPRKIPYRNEICYLQGQLNFIKALLASDQGELEKIWKDILNRDLKRIRNDELLF